MTLPRLDRVSCILGIAIVSILGATFVSLRGRGSDVSPLLVPEQSLRLGDVWMQSRYRLSVPVLNRIDEPVSVALSSSCGCATPEPSHFLLQPHAKMNIELMLDLRTVNPGLTHASQYHFETYLTAAFEASRSTGEIVWPIVGNVHRVLDVEPQVIDFADSVVVGQERTEPHYAVVTPMIPLSSIRVVYEPSLVSAAVEKRGEHEWRLSVKPSLDLKEGSFSCDVQLIAVGAQANIPPVVVPCKGEALPEIRAVPRALMCGALQSDRPTTESICIVSVGKRPFSVHTVSIPSGVTVQSHIANADNTVHELVLCLRAVKAGTWGATASFRAVDGDGRVTPVDVQIRAYVMGRDGSN